MSYNTTPGGGNTYIASLFSPGIAHLKLSLYRNKLIFDFTLCVGTDKKGGDIYDNTRRVSTSIDLRGAAYLYLAAVSALRGGDSAERIEAPLSCRNSASLTFIYRRNEKNRMEASLLFNNPGINIPFVFPTLWKDVRVNHEMVYEGVQADLGVFAMILFGYVAGSSAGEFPDIEYLQKIFQAGLNP